MPAGVYEIDMTWTAASNLTTQLGLDLYDGVGNWIGQIPVNEQVAPSDFSEQGVQWKRLGSIDITSNIFHISTWNSPTDGAIDIDAIRLRAAPTIDDGDVAGSLEVLSRRPERRVRHHRQLDRQHQGAYGGSQTSSSTAGSGSSIATWTMPVTPGSYEVDATWAAGSGLSPIATYNIYDGSTSWARSRVNQTRPPAASRTTASPGIRWAASPLPARADGHAGQHRGRRPGLGRRHSHPAGLSAGGDRQQRLSGLLVQRRLDHDRPAGCTAIPC